MNRVRLMLVLVLAVGCGGVLAYATYNYVQSTHVQVEAQPIEMRPVVVAASSLSLGSELRPQDVWVVQWPASAVPPGAYSHASEVVGRGVISPLVEYEPVLPGKLAPLGAGAGLPPLIPPGMRAVSVRVNEVIGVAGYVLPGSRVDILATASATDNRADMTSKVVLANVEVLTAGTRLEQDQEDGRPLQVTVVTLLVNPEQSERLALASTEGKIQLALRNPLDASAPETPGIRPAVLLAGSNSQPAPRPAPAPRAAPAPAPAPATPEPSFPVVEIIRGADRANEVVR